MRDQNLTCIGCPLGCSISVSLSNNGEVSKITGNTCKKGEEYARKEVTNPSRVVTSIVKINNGDVNMVSVKTAEDIEKAVQSPADYILLDQGAGGTGETFDWSLVPAIKRPWFLAGGLGCENLESAIHLLHPWAVDLSSSVETGGHKDPDKILEAVYAVRSIKEEI